MMNLHINYSTGNGKTFLKRYKIQFLIILTLLVFGIGPIIADQISGDASQNTTTENPTISSEASPTPTIENSDSPNTKSNETQGLETNMENQTVTEVEKSAETPTPTPTVVPPFAVSDQRMLIQIPRVQRIDPRAKQFFLPQVNFNSEGSPFMMLCIDSTGGTIDLLSKGIDDSFERDYIYFKGDLSQSIQISGTSNQVLNIFNSFGGLKISGIGGRSVVGTFLLLRFVAISEPTNDYSLCGESAPSGQWLIQLQPLGLQVDTKKNSLNLGDKTKKP